jgi:hypothetical protein
MLAHKLKIQQPDLQLDLQLCSNKNPATQSWSSNATRISRAEPEFEAVLPEGGTTIAQPFKVGYERPKTQSVPKGRLSSVPKVSLIISDAMFPE